VSAKSCPACGVADGSHDPTCPEPMKAGARPITACTKCGRRLDQVSAEYNAGDDARCRNNPMGAHTWRTRSRREWFDAWR
jgi:hypothetical protein